MKENGAKIVIFCILAFIPMLLYYDTRVKFETLKRELVNSINTNIKVVQMRQLETQQNVAPKAEALKLKEIEVRRPKPDSVAPNRSLDRLGMVPPQVGMTAKILPAAGSTNRRTTMPPVVQTARSSRGSVNMRQTPRFSTLMPPTKKPEGAGDNYGSISDWPCSPDVPCRYPEVVDFRAIVIVYNRHRSLQKLLNSLNTVLMDGDSARLEIWIDRRKDNKVHLKTLQTANNFTWSRGPTRVHVQKRNVGIMGQWIDSWAPNNHTFGSSEIVLILEDDINVSPFVYRWLKAVHRQYGRRKDFLGATLLSDELKTLDGRYSKLRGPKNDTVFMYKSFGTWGFSPSPYQWHRFQSWYHEVAKPNASFHPYVPGIAPTRWYQHYERIKRADTMWSMWLLYYAHMKKLYTVFNNLAYYNNDTKSCLCICRREVGLHTSWKGRENYCKLLSDWDKKYIQFPKTIARLDWNGKPVSGEY